VLALGDYLHVVCHACVGGTDVREDMSKLRAGVHMVVGTPGRVYDMIENRRCLTVKKMVLFVLDEADEMLSRGFKSQIHDIFKFLPQDIQIALFSATMPQEVLEVANKFMRNPKRILVKHDELTLEGIKQFFVQIEHENDKFSTLIDLYQTLTITQSIIYVNSRRKADEIANEMRSHDFTVSKMVCFSLDSFLSEDYGFIFA
jgi:translation initiation factor 4A